MPGMTKKAEWIETWYSLGERIWGLAPWAGVISSAVVAGWLAKLTNFLAAYGPVSWLICGLTAGFLFAGICWFASSSARQLALRNQIQLTQRPADAVNPLDDVFTRRRIAINTLNLPSTGPIRNKTFVDCELLGPVTVAFLGGSVEGAAFMNCDFFKVPNTARILNGVAFENVAIRRGKLISLTILVPESFVASFPPETPWIN